jgi:hypothetical protein
MTVIGAGRFIDVGFPVPYATVPNMLLSITRAGVVLNNTNTGAGGLTTTVGCSDGVDCVQLCTSAVGDLNSVTFSGSLICHVRTTAGGFLGGPGAGDETNVYRVVACLAGVGIDPAAAGDFGLEVLVVAGGTFVLAGATGWAITLASNSVARFDVRGPNGLVSYNLTAAPFDTRKFHAYEIRLYSATFTAPGRVEAYVDGVRIPLPALTATWAAGTNNPPAVIAGFVPAVVNRAGVASNKLQISSVRLIAGVDALSVV